MSPATIEALYREHNDRTLAILRRRFHTGRCRDRVEDGLASAWLILARKPDGYIDGGGNVGGWLYVVASREVLRAPAGPETVPLLADEYVGLAVSDDVHAIVVNRDRVHELVNFTRDERVSAPRRRAVAARMLGLSYAELGEMTGTTYTHVNRSTAEGMKLARTSSRYIEA